LDQFLKDNLKGTAFSEEIYVQNQRVLTAAIFHTFLRGKKADFLFSSLKLVKISCSNF
jgi:hypothetical protein